jgi:ubiquinone biosynthesis protein COQ4
MAGLSQGAVMKLRREERSLLFNTYLTWAFKTGLNSQPLINVYWEEELGTDVDVLPKRLRIAKPLNLRELRNVGVGKEDKGRL